MTTEISTKVNATLENRAIAAEIRTQLLNEAFKLREQIMEQAEVQREEIKQLVAGISGPFITEDLEVAMRGMDRLLSRAQENLSTLEQATSQITAALVEYRIRKRTVEMVIRRFVGGSKTESKEALRVTDGNGRTRLPTVKAL